MPGKLLLGTKEQNAELGLAFLLAIENAVEAVERRPDAWPRMTTTTYDSVLAAAQKLSVVDRLRLVGALWESIEADERPLPSQEWIEEVQRRSAAHDRGELTAQPWESVRARARRHARLDG